MGVSAAQAGSGVGIISLEMDRGTLAARIASDLKAANAFEKLSPDQRTCACGRSPTFRARPKRQPS
jgi:hypothetical protein